MYPMRRRREKNKKIFVHKPGENDPINLTWKDNIKVCFFPGITTHCNCIFTAWLRALASSFSRFLDHTQRPATVGRTPLDEYSASRRDLHLTTHNTHNRQTSMPPVGFEPTITAGERLKTYALDRTAIGTGVNIKVELQNNKVCGCRLHSSCSG